MKLREIFVHQSSSRKRQEKKRVQTFLCVYNYFIALARSDIKIVSKSVSKSIFEFIIITLAIFDIEAVFPLLVDFNGSI